MSVYASAAVWEHSKADGTKLLVLLAIADFADKFGGNSWPAVETIASMCRVSRPTVKRVVRELVEMGELECEVQAGGTPEMRADRRPNRYRLLLMGSGDGGSPVSPRGAPDGGSSGGDGGSPGAPTGVHSCEPQSTQDPSTREPPNAEALFDAASADGFDQFWALYPRRRGKADAHKAWRAALKRGTRIDDILRATRHYAASRVVERGFVMNATRFLRSEWEDFADGDPDARRQRTKVDLGKLSS